MAVDQIRCAFRAMYSSSERVRSDVVKLLGRLQTVLRTGGAIAGYKRSLDELLRCRIPLNDGTRRPRSAILSLRSLIMCVIIVSHDSIAAIFCGTHGPISTTRLTSCGPRAK